MATARYSHCAGLSPRTRGSAPYHATGSITGVYEYGCELFKKRMECAIMIKVAENQELAAQGIEVPIELGSTCNACADGEACE